jgi:hypothetical protein
MMPDKRRTYTAEFKRFEECARAYQGVVGTANEHRREGVCVQV